MPPRHRSLYIVCLALLAWALAGSPAAAGADPAVARSEHYEVTIDGSQELAEGIAERLDTMLEEGYQQLLSVRPPRGRRFPVRILADREAYHEYCREKEGKDSKRPSFVYLHFGRGNVQNEAVGFVMDEVPLMRRLFHECWHQYLRSAVDEPPQWLNEGFGECFEGFWVTDEGEVVPEVSRGMHRRLREGIFDWDEGPLNEHYGRRPVADVCGFAKREFLRDEAVNYALSWALCYYLLESEDKSCRGVLPRIGRALRPDADREENTKRVLKALRRKGDLEEIEEKLEEFYRELQVPGYEKLQSAIRALVGNRFSEARTLLREVVDEAPDFERGWFYLGQLLYRQGEHEEAATCLRRATDLFPEYAPAHQLLALSSEKLRRYDEALAAATRAARFNKRLEKQMEELKKRVRAAKESNGPDEE